MSTVTLHSGIRPDVIVPSEYGYTFPREVANRIRDQINSKTIFVIHGDPTPEIDMTLVAGIVSKARFTNCGLAVQCKIMDTPEGNWLKSYLAKGYTPTIGYCLNGSATYHGDHNTVNADVDITCFQLTTPREIGLPEDAYEGLPPHGY